MKQTSFLQKSLTELQHSNPKLAYQLQAIDPSPIEFFYDQNNQLNLKREYEGQIYYYHSPINAVEEAKSWFKQLNLQQESVLFVYGVGLGYYYEAAKEWLKSNSEHRIIFLEVDLTVIHRLLETKQGYHLLKDKQVRLIHYTNVWDDKELFSELAWNYVADAFKISALKLYMELSSEDFGDLQHCISHEIVKRRSVVDEYFGYSIPFFRNFYSNLLELPHAYYGNALFGAFKNIPAIICGAGPSLNKNLEQLKTLANQALIFAGSSSLPALISKGVIPHFGAAIDPNDTQSSRVEFAKGHDIPFFYRNRLFPEALKAISGPRLYLTGTGGYEVSDWFDEQLRIDGEILDEGHNVINFSIAIAYALGCNPIVLVGVDLAFTNHQLYAEGVLSSLHLPTHLSDEELTKKTENFDTQPILKEDIYGNPVFTVWKWVAESEWISNFAKEHTDATILNCTEGGLGFKEVPNLSLQDFIEQYKSTHLSQPQDFHQRIKTLIKNHSFHHLTTQKMIDLMEEFKLSLERCILNLDALIDEMDQFLTKLKHKQAIPESLETQETLLNEMAIQEEVGYHYLLNIFSTVYTTAKQHEIQHAMSSKRKKISKALQKRKILIQKERLKFLKNAALINIALIKRSLSK